MSGALALTADRVDFASGVLVFVSLKKRHAGFYRAAPAPSIVLDALGLVHGLRKRQARGGQNRGERLWPWSLMIGWQVVYGMMQAAQLEGPYASPKGLRHNFGMAAVSAGILLNLAQNWLGLARLSTTAIHAGITGAEE